MRSVVALHAQVLAPVVGALVEGPPAGGGEQVGPWWGPHPLAWACMWRAVALHACAQGGVGGICVLRSVGGV